MGGIVETVVFCTSRELVLCGGFLATEGPMAVIKVLGFGHIYIYICVVRVYICEFMYMYMCMHI